MRGVVLPFEVLALWAHAVFLPAGALEARPVHTLDLTYCCVRESFARLLTLFAFDFVCVDTPFGERVFYWRRDCVPAGDALAAKPFVHDSVVVCCAALPVRLQQAVPQAEQLLRSTWCALLIQYQNLALPERARTLPTTNKLARNGLKCGWLQRRQTKDIVGRLFRFFVQQIQAIHRASTGALWGVLIKTPILGDSHFFGFLPPPPPPPP